MRRYQSVREMIDRLDARADGRVPIQCHVTFVKRVNASLTKLIERHPLVFTAAILLVVAGLATMPLWLGGP